MESRSILPQEEDEPQVKTLAHTCMHRSMHTRTRTHARMLIYVYVNSQEEDEPQVEETAPGASAEDIERLRRMFGGDLGGAA